MISKVYLRKKKISKGRVSLYLDFYPPILIPGTNRTTRRYFLNVHLPEKPKSFAEREHVKSIMQKMEIFRLRVLEQIINGNFDFPLPPYKEQIRIVETVQRIFDQLDTITESL